MLFREDGEKMVINKRDLFFEEECCWTRKSGDREETIEGAWGWRTISQSNGFLKACKEHGSKSSYNVAHSASTDFGVSKVSKDTPSDSLRVIVYYELNVKVLNTQSVWRP